MNEMYLRSWIIRNGIQLSYLYASSGKYSNDRVVLLIPGFSEPMCDWDYFMSRLMRLLLHENIPVIMFEPKGHGESGGLIDDLLLDEYIEDVNALIHFIRSEIKAKEIIGVGRGLSASVLSYFNVVGSIDAVAGLNPYYYTSRVIKNLIYNIKSDEIEIMDLFLVYKEKQDLLMQFFESLGAYLLNVKGQKVRKEFLIELYRYDFLKYLKNSKRTLWIISDYHKECGYLVSHDFPDDSYKNFINDKNKYFSSRVEWEYSIMCEFTKWIVGQEQ